jgi:hypothetical protein
VTACQQGIEKGEDLADSIARRFNTLRNKRIFTARAALFGETL